MATTGRRLSTAKAARNGVYRLETNVSKLKLFRQHVCSKQKIPEKKPFNLAGWHLVFGPKTKVLWNSLFPQPKQTFPKQTFSQKQTNKLVQTRRRLARERKTRFSSSSEYGSRKNSR